MNLSDVVARCSKFSGWKLEARVEESRGTKVLVIEEPGKPGSKLAVYKSPISPLVLVEAYGRMRHWGITEEEKWVLLQALA